MFRPVLLGFLLLITPGVLTAQARPPNQDQPSDALGESAGVSPAPPMYAPIPSASLRLEPGTRDTSASPQIMRISGGVMAGQVLTRVFPEYSPDSLAKGCGRTTVFSVTIAADGKVHDATQTYGPTCDGSALRAVRQWIYRPYLLNGKPVTVSTTVTLSMHHNAGTEATPHD